MKKQEKECKEGVSWEKQQDLWSLLERTVVERMH